MLNPIKYVEPYQVLILCFRRIIIIIRIYTQYIYVYIYIYCYYKYIYNYLVENVYTYEIYCVTYNTHVFT